jgi:malic enzyme
LFAFDKICLNVQAACALAQALMALRDSEVDVFLALAQQHTQEILPLLYTPTVAQVPCPCSHAQHADPCCTIVAAVQ